VFPQLEKSSIIITLNNNNNNLPSLPSLPSLPFISSEDDEYEY
jgi:hypothetical protein